MVENLDKRCYEAMRGANSGKFDGHNYRGGVPVLTGSIANLTYKSGARAACSVGKALLL